MSDGGAAGCRVLKRLYGRKSRWSALSWISGTRVVSLPCFRQQMSPWVFRNRLGRLIYRLASKISDNAALIHASAAPIRMSASLHMNATLHGQSRSWLNYIKLCWIFPLHFLHVGGCNAVHTELALAFLELHPVVSIPEFTSSQTCGLKKIFRLHCRAMRNYLNCLFVYLFIYLEMSVVWNHWPQQNNDSFIYKKITNKYCFEFKPS